MLDTTDGIVGRVARAAEFDERSVQEIQAAVREALQNAIVHGNRCDQGRCVKLQLDLHPGELEISVQDEGEGFHENPARSGGRGILLMKSLMDEVVFRRLAKGGMAVTMRRRRAAARNLESCGAGAGSAMWWRDSADDGE